MAPEHGRSRARTIVKWTAIVVGAALVVATGAFFAWALTPLGPTSSALAALETGDGVTVNESDDGWVFAPVGTAETTAGLVFYPGGRVDARSYAPFARDLAARGHRVALAKMPLSLAVFDVDAADNFIGAPGTGVESWAVGGHSLGGAMAAQYAATHEETVSGLLLLASYASGGADMSDAKLAAHDVTASNDSVLDQANWEAGQALLPALTDHMVIKGGNHAQFGDYGEQPGDSPATISGDDQRRQAVDAADTLLKRLGQAQ